MHWFMSRVLDLVSLKPWPAGVPRFQPKSGNFKIYVPSLNEMSVQNTRTIMLNDRCAMPAQLANQNLKSPLSELTPGKHYLSFTYMHA